MTTDERHALDALAKDISVGTSGLYPPAVYPLLRGAAETLAALAWQEGETCQMCPRPMRKHVCSCPHALAKKRLQQFGVWPA